MRQLHLFTIGTSILTNFERKYPKFLEKLGYQNIGRLPPDHPLQEKIMGSAHKGNILFDKLYGFVKEDPERASAELNAFLKFQSLYGYNRPGETEIGLYTTDTGSGWLCGRLIYTYLKENGYVLNEPVRVRDFGLGYNFFDSALLNLIDNFSKIIFSKRRKGYRIYVNVTAGFKPETCFTTIISLLFGVDKIYYIHESFHEIVVIPAVPLSIDREFLKMIDIDGSPVYWVKEKYGEKILEELDRKGLIYEKSGKIFLRKWVKRLMVIWENEKQ